MRSLPLSLVSLSLVLGIGCSSKDNQDDDSQDSGDTGASVTWNSDIQPLLEAYCTSCHSEGGVGGFSLEDYESSYALRHQVLDSVSNLRMPPWKANGECNSYDYDFSLSESQQTLLSSWVEGGAVEGDPEAPVNPVTPPDSKPLSRIDLSLGPDLAYTPSTEENDDYRCFVLDWPYEEEVFVTGFRMRPGNESVVHHGIVFLAGPDLADDAEALDAAEEGPGYTCYGGPGISDISSVRWLGSWVPGANAGDLPEGTGIRVEEGSKLLLQVHYNTSGANGESDLSMLDLSVETSVEKPALIQPWTNPNWLEGVGMEIPANSEGVTHSFSYTLDGSFELLLHSSALHMHRQGQQGRFWITDSDGVETCLLEIDDWDFDWQQSYILSDPVVLGAGDTVTVECTWDNPTDEDLAWGEGTDDEMCLATMFLTVN